MTITDPLANVAHTRGAEDAYNKLPCMAPSNYCIRLKQHYVAGYRAELAFEAAQHPLPFGGAAKTDPQTLGAIEFFANTSPVRG
jgi:hypothetical protein